MSTQLMDEYHAHPHADRVAWLSTLLAERGDDLLYDYDYLRLRLEHHGLDALIADIPEQDAHALLRRALNDARDALKADPHHLAGQLVGRLAGRAGLLGELAAQAAHNPGLLPDSATLNPPDPAQLGAYEQHQNFIGGLVVMPDGKTVVSSSEDGSIQVWDLHTQTLRRQMNDHGTAVNRLLLHPSGQQLFSGGDDNLIRVWNTQTWTCTRILRGHQDYVNAMAISQDGRRMVTAGRCGEVLIWDAENLELIHRFDGHSEWVVGAAVSPDGKMAVTSAINNTIWAWDLDTLERLDPFYDSNRGEVIHIMGMFIGDNNTSGVGHKSYAKVLRFSEDGTTLYSAGDIVISWDVETRQQKRRYPGGGWPIKSMAVLPGDRVIYGAHALQVLDLESGEVAFTLRGHDKDVDSIAVVGDGRRVVSGGHDNKVRVWDLERSGVRAHTGRVSALQFTPNGQHLVSSASDSSVRIWSLNPLKTRHILGDMKGIFAEVKGITPDGKRVVATTSDSEMRLWDIQSGRLVHPLTFETHYSFEGVDLTADGRYAVAGAVGEFLTLWDLAEGGPPKVFAGKTSFLSNVRILDDERVLTAASYQRDDKPGYLQLWSLSRLEEVKRVNAEGAEYFTKMVLLDDMVVLTGSKGGLYQYRVDDLSKVSHDVIDENGLPGLMTADDGRVLTAHSDGTIRAREPGNLSQSETLVALPVEKLNRIVKHGDLLVYSSGALLGVFSLTARRVVGTFQADSAISAIAVSNDQIAIGEQQGRVHRLRLNT